MRTLSPLDRCLGLVQSSLVTLGPGAPAHRPCPQVPEGAASARPLSEQDKALSASLMRVNHVGELCAQALYEAQALTARDPGHAATFRAAALEEQDHLAWTRGRVTELGGRVSWLSPLWYGGALAIGFVAGRAGDPVSLGFMAETERQVEEHLGGHLQRLPPHDAASRAIVAQMQADEVRHARTAEAAGAAALPWVVRQGMRVAAKVMTATAHHI